MLFGARWGRRAAHRRYRVSEACTPDVDNTTQYHLLASRISSRLLWSANVRGLSDVMPRSSRHVLRMASRGRSQGAVAVALPWHCSTHACYRFNSSNMRRTSSGSREWFLFSSKLWEDHGVCETLLACVCAHEAPVGTHWLKTVAKSGMKPSGGLGSMYCCRSRMRSNCAPMIGVQQVHG